VCVVEIWRIVATSLLAVSGFMAVLIVMADVRERRNAKGAQVATTGAVGVTILLLVGVLMLTVLPSWLSWGIVVVVSTGVGLLMFAS